MVREVWTAEQPPSAESPRTGDNGGRLAPPAPLFAAAILPGAAALSPPLAPVFPGPGLPVGRLGGGAPIYPHAPDARALLVCAASWVPRHPGNLTNRFGAKKKKIPARGGRLDPRGRSGRCFVEGGALREILRFPPPAVE